MIPQQLGSRNDVESDVDISSSDSGFDAGGLPPTALSRPADSWSQSAIQAATRRAWEGKVVELSERGISIGDLLAFSARLGTSAGPMPHFDSRRSTTSDVVWSAIIPESRLGPSIGEPLDQTSWGNCALATVINCGVPKLPHKLVTHWGNVWNHTVAAVIADALDVPTYNLRSPTKYQPLVVCDCSWKILKGKGNIFFHTGSAPLASISIARFVQALETVAWSRTRCWVHPSRRAIAVSQSSSKGTSAR